MTRQTDYPMAFRDTQDLELIRRKLVKASLILKSNGEVGASWEKGMTKLTDYLASVELEHTFSMMRKYVSEMSQHARVVHSLLERLNGTHSLVRRSLPSFGSADVTNRGEKLFEILHYRNHELQLQINTAAEASGKQLTVLTEQARAENESMTRLTADIQNDSNFIKLLTFLTVLYAPASLVAVSHFARLRLRLTPCGNTDPLKSLFNSNLIQLVRDGEMQGQTRLMLVSDFYLFPVLTICLITVTLLPTLWWRSIWPVVYSRNREHLRYIRGLIWH